MSDTKNGPEKREYRAKIFRNGRSQTIRLPKDLRFDEDEKEVRVWRERGRLVVASADQWSADFWQLFGSVPDLQVPRRTPLAEVRDRLNR